MNKKVLISCQKAEILIFMALFFSSWQGFWLAGLLLLKFCDEV